MTNIVFTHKFQSRTAALQGARQNLEHMIYLFWFDNTPQHMREIASLQEDVKEEIETRLDDDMLPHMDLLQISNLATQLVEDTVNTYKKYGALYRES